MRKLLKMEMYEARHNYICLLMIGIAIIYGAYTGCRDLEMNYYDLPLGGYEALIAILHDAPGTCILISAFPALLIGKSFSNRTLIAKYNNVVQTKIFINVIIFTPIGALNPYFIVTAKTPEKE